MEELKTDFKEWCIVELMGHVRIAGLVTEVERFGSKLGRVDIPNAEGFTTQFFNGASVYRLTPTTEEIARAVAISTQPEPVHRWELPKLNAGSPEAIDADDDDDDDEMEGYLGHRNHDDDESFG